MNEEERMEKIKQDLEKGDYNSFMQEMDRRVKKLLEWQEREIRKQMRIYLGLLIANIVFIVVGSVLTIMGAHQERAGMELTGDVLRYIGNMFGLGIGYWIIKHAGNHQTHKLGVIVFAINLFCIVLFIINNFLS